MGPDPSTIGIDIAKTVFQVHGIDGSGEPVVRRQLRRRQVLPFFGRLSPCLVGMEACATAHHWAREITAMGHKVRLMPPASRSISIFRFTVFAKIVQPSPLRSSFSTVIPIRLRELRC